MSRARAFVAVGTLVLLQVLVSACGMESELDPFEGGTEVQVVGAIDIPSTDGGDFVPGVLRVTAGYPLSASQMQTVLDQRVPGGQASAVQDEPTQMDVAVPPGTSLEAAARSLGGETAITKVELRRPEDQQAVGPMLVETHANTLVDDSPRLVWLSASDSELLTPHAFGKVVRVTGVLMRPATEVSPTTVLQVQRVEPLGFLPVVAEGTFYKVGPSGTCLVLITDAGEVLALHGSEASNLARSAGSGDRVAVTYLDAGLSVGACSGGRQVAVQEFVRR